MTQPSSIKSPFIVLENVLSPLQCEELVDSADFHTMEVNKHGQPTVSTKISPIASALIHPIIERYADRIVDTYGSEIHSIEDSRMLWMDETVENVGAICDNAFRAKHGWMRVHDRDVTAVLWLSDYNDRPPFDGEFEVYGGKLEFPSHGFGFNPTRGTLALFPCDPHFAHTFSPVKTGELFMVKTFITLATPLLYSPKAYPGTWHEWLQPHF